MLSTRINLYTCACQMCQSYVDDLHAAITELQAVCSNRK